MSEPVSPQDLSTVAQPISAFSGPVGELISQGMLAPPVRPGLLAALDQFDILRTLGGGGMGIVLLGRDPETGKDVAIKLVKSELLSNEPIVHRFLKEAGHLKRLRHSNIVPVLRVSDRREGPYFVMPYFEKGSLANRIKVGQPLDTESILDIASQIADGLSFAHRSGIIHRDLKPANILIEATGKVCLADFGLARTLFNDTMLDVENRQLEGTAPYMSPEIVAGDAGDTRCDIYSFGALLYEMLTGLPPYQGRGAKEVLNQIISAPPKPITVVNPAADAGLVTVAEACMARELRNRYADMRDVLEDLERIKKNQPPIALREPSRKKEAGRPQSGGLTKLVWIPVILAALAGLFWLTRPQKRPTQAINPTNVVVLKPMVFHVATLAGQAGAAGYTDAVGNQARFHLPKAVAVDGMGNLYVADTANNIIRRIARDRTVSTFAGVAGRHGSTDGPGSQALFWGPFGLAADHDGNVFVADTGNNTIRKIDTNRVVSTLAGTAGAPGKQDGQGAEARFRNPWGVAIDPDGNICVADMDNNAIRRITPGGLVTTVAQTPLGAGVDGVATQLSSPFALAVDTARNIYVADNFSDTIKKLAPDGTINVLAGLPGIVGTTDETGTSARFANPQGLALDAEGNLFVVDTGNHTMRKITPGGEVKTVAGFAGKEGSAEGIGTDTLFSSPCGVAVDREGNIYVADSRNHTVRKVVFGPKD